MTVRGISRRAGRTGDIAHGSEGRRLSPPGCGPGSPQSEHGEQATHETRPPNPPNAKVEHVSRPYCHSCGGALARKAETHRSSGAPLAGAHRTPGGGGTGSKAVVRPPHAPHPKIAATTLCPHRVPKAPGKMLIWGASSGRATGARSRLRISLSDPVLLRLGQRRVELCSLLGDGNHLLGCPRPHCWRRRRPP